MATSKGTMFDPTLVKDLITKVKGKSALAALCGQTPIPFNGLKEMIFSMDNEIDIVAENGKKTEGGIAIAGVPLQILFEQYIPVKMVVGNSIVGYGSIMFSGKGAYLQSVAYGNSVSWFGYGVVIVE